MMEKQRKIMQRTAVSQGNVAQQETTLSDFEGDQEPEPQSVSTCVKEILIPDGVKQNVLVNYQNVLPSKLRHGNNNVMPLWPSKVDETFTTTDANLLKRIIQGSSYTLA